MKKRVRLRIGADDSRLLSTDTLKDIRKPGFIKNYILYVIPMNMENHRFRRDGEDGTVIFNFLEDPIGDLGPFAMGYRRAAQRLLTIFSTQGYADFDGYPILFLYRHALELSLKAVIIQGARLLGLLDATTVNTQKLLERHELSPLIPPIRDIFKTVNWKAEFQSDTLKNFDDLAALIRDIERIDPRSYHFRYPIDTKGEGVLSHHFPINVPEFSRQLEPVLQFLETASMGLDAYIDAVGEELAELKKYVSE